MVAVQTKVELEGPFFTHKPGDTLYQNIGRMLDGLAEQMDEKVSEQIRAHASEMQFYTGYTLEHVVGYTTSPTTGKHWATWAAVGVPTAGMGRADAIRTKAAAAGIERRWHPFRNVKSAVYRAKAIISADLAKGLN